MTDVTQLRVWKQSGLSWVLVSGPCLPHGPLRRPIPLPVPPQRLTAEQADHTCHVKRWPSLPYTALHPHPAPSNGPGAPTSSCRTPTPPTPDVISAFVHKLALSPLPAPPESHFCAFYLIRPLEPLAARCHQTSLPLHCPLPHDRLSPPPHGDGAQPAAPAVVPL